jgi:hypothetical protein
MPESFVRDELSAGRDGQRAGGENPRLDSFLQNVKGAMKAIILRSEIARQERKTGFSIGQRQIQGVW